MFSKRKEWTSKLTPLLGKKAGQGQTSINLSQKELLLLDPPAYSSGPVPQLLPELSVPVAYELDSTQVASVPPLTWNYSAPARATSASHLSFNSVDVRIGNMIRVLQPLEEKRARLLKAKLVSIQSRISNWSRERDIDTITQLEEMLLLIPSVTRDTMLEICQRLKDWVNSSEKHVLVQEPGNSETAKMVFLETMVDGYDALEILRGVCNGLYNLVPFLSSRGFTVPRLETAVNTGNAESISGTAERSSLSQSGFSNSEIQSVPLVQVQSEGGVDEQPPAEINPSIKLLYSSVLRALQTVTFQLDNKDLANTTCSRMVVWGCGLFQMSKSLDSILEQNDLDSTAEFRSHVVGVLADIAVIIAILLRAYDDSPDPEVQRSLNSLEACFGRSKEFNEEAMEDGPDLPDTVENDDRETFSQNCMTQVNGLVDCLFEVLPAIDRLRQLWILDLEKRSREFASSLAAITTSSLEVNRPVKGQSLGKSTVSETMLTNVSGYSPSQQSRSSNFDELNFTEQPSEMAYFGKGKSAVPVSPLGSPQSLEEARLLRRHRKNPRAVERDTNETHQSLQDIIVMDLELATAMRLSLVEAQTQAAMEKQEDANIMAELKEWDEEIKRLKNWSDIFESTLGPAPSEAETTRLHSIFQQLAKIGRAFASASPKMGTGVSSDVKDAVEGRLERAATIISKSKVGLFDTKVDIEKKTYGEALQTFREVNNYIHAMGTQKNEMWDYAINNSSNTVG